MKNVFKTLAIASATAMLVACGGGGESGGSNPNQPNLVTTAGSSVTIPVNAAQRYQISGGVPPYRVGNSDQAIALGSVKGSELLIGAVSGGTTTVTVYDYSGNAVPTEVRVGSSIALHTTAPGNLTVGVGAASARTFTVAGGAAPYIVTGSDANVARVEQISANQWRVTGVASGGSTVQIRDAAGATVDVNLTVGAPELSLGMTDLVMPVGLEAVVKITGGQPPYRLGGGIPAAIRAEIVGDELRLVGLLASELEVSVLDMAGQSAKVAVEINTATTAFRFSPGQVTVSEDDNQQLLFTTFEGVGEVCYFSSNPALLRPLVNGCTTERQIVVDTGTAGSRCVEADTTVQLTAVDANRSTATASILVVNSNAAPCGLEPFGVAAGTLTARVGGNAQTFVTGAVGTVSIISSDTAVATATVGADGVLNVIGVAAGTARITLRDEAGRTATVTVTVS